MKMRLALTLLFLGTCLRPIAASLPVSVNALQSLQAANSIQTVRGTVTRTGPSLFVQDATGGLKVNQIENSPPLHIGDQVTVTGRVAQGRFGVTLLGATVRLLYASVPAPPLAITPDMASSGLFDNRFVETEGRFQSRRWTAKATQLVLRSGHQVFVADISGQADLRSLKIDSLLRVRGVCLMGDETFTDRMPFRILMRSPDDVDVIAGPPFWTRKHLVALALLLLLLSLGAHLIYLRVERWRFRILLEDRTRTAHDLHDTLAQGFAGVAFQLQAVKNAIATPEPELCSHVDLAISMVSHSHEDARRAIAMLKPAEFDGGDLLDEMQHQGRQLTQGGGVQFNVRTFGPVREMDEKVQGALLRIGHEAITNAVRHASPHIITLELRFNTEEVKLRIEDDGCGLLTSKGRSRGFGIAGMRARATGQFGTLTIRSEPGSGTVVEACLPLNRPKRRTDKFRGLLVKG